MGDERDRGARPSIDKTGAVHGSGSGAGGGNPGEDFDDDPVAGGEVLPTGATERDTPLSKESLQATRNQSSVTPEDYPVEDRARSTP